MKLIARVEALGTAAFPSMQFSLVHKTYKYSHFGAIYVGPVWPLCCEETALSHLHTSAKNDHMMDSMANSKAVAVVQEVRVVIYRLENQPCSEYVEVSLD